LIAAQQNGDAIIDGNKNIIKHRRHLVVDTGTMVGNEMTCTVVDGDGSDVTTS